MENNYLPISGLKKEDFQRELQGKKTDLFFLHNENGNLNIEALRLEREGSENEDD